MRKLSCHFINIHHTDKWVSDVWMKNLPDLRKKETSRFMDIAAEVVERGSRHHTLLPWEHRGNSSATV